MSTRIVPKQTRLRGGGVELAADVWGDPAHPPIIFLHGAGQSRRAWDEAARALAARGWHALTVDHRGHGDSEWPVDTAYEWADFADDVDALVGHCAQPPVVVGASLGGIAALTAQGRAAQQLYRALILVDVTPRLRLQGVKRIVGFMAANPDGFADLDEASQVIAEFTGRSKPPSPEPLRQVLREGPDKRWRWHWDVRFLEGRADAILAADEESARTNTMREELLDAARRVRVPTLVVRGAQSDMVSPHAVRELVEIVAGARYVDVADAGHMVAGDQNDRFIDAIVHFLTDLPGAPSQGFRS